MMTLHKLSAGDGWRYYTQEIASGDVLRAKGRKIGDYYTVEGLPPGQWVGSGAAQLELHGTVSEHQMDILFSGYKLPVTREELSDVLKNRALNYIEIKTQAYEEKRLEFAQKMWETVYAKRCGKIQEEIAEYLSEDGKRLAQRTISHRLAKLEESGNDLSPYPSGTDIDDKEALKQNFLRTYKMSDWEKKLAASHAQKAEQAARTKDNQQAENTHTFKQADTPYMRLLEEKKAAFFRQQHRQASGAELRAIKREAGAITFRQEHHREPKNDVELRKWMAQQSTAKQQIITGFDAVLTPPKSVSIAWGLGDETLRTGIENAHEKAIQDVVHYLESQVIYTRRGQGGIAQEDVDSGIIATKYRHYDSREGDPNIHDHMVIANKVQGQDGRWLTLDGRMLYSYNVAASELYNTQIAKHIHQDLGLEFAARKKHGGVIHELAGINEEAIHHFSARRQDIDGTLDKLVEQFIENHGYPPNANQRIKLQQQATLETRPSKGEVKSLSELNTQWVQSVNESKLKLPTGEDLLKHLKRESTKQASSIAKDIAQALATSDIEHAHKIIARLEESRSTWRKSNIEAEAQRYFRDITGGAGIDEDKFRSTLKATEAVSINLNNYEEQLYPDSARRKDGTSIYLNADYKVFTSHRILNDEQAIIEAATIHHSIPSSTPEIFAQEEQKLLESGALISDAQRAMAKDFATSQKLLSIGIGPAGAGKTSSSKLTVAAATAAGRQVIGLAPTAAAASVMRQELGIEADTLDKFLITPMELNPGDMLLVDEIGMVSTPKLAAIIRMAKANGAVVRGIGDYRQLAAIGSGGALRLIEREAGATYLEDVYRFRNQEEAAASLALREPAINGADKPFDWYLENNRIVSGESQTMLDSVFAAWAKDTEEGKNSLMLAGTNDEVTRLSELAQVRAIDLGKVKTGTYTTLHTGSRAYKGDVIVTRENNRRLLLNRGKDFVKNGDLWIVKHVHKDGSLKVKNQASGGVITLPESYVKTEVELGYAATINRAQGSTVDTVHAAVTSSTDRAGAYVALSRGRDSNNLYVVTDENNTQAEVLEAITNNYDTNLSVHEEVQRLYDEHLNIAHRIDIYEDLSVRATEEGMKTVAAHALGEPTARALASCPAWGALAHELADTYRHGLDPVEVLSRAYSSGELGNAKDVAAVLHWRIQNIREDDAQKRTHTLRSPLAAISDEHLDRLVHQAKKTTIPLSERKLEQPNWASYPYALAPTDELRQRLVQTNKALTANEKDPQAYAQLNEKVSQMSAEIARRRWASAEQQEVEKLVRGEIPRSKAKFTVRDALVHEQKMRQNLLPTLEQPAPKNVVQQGISRYSLDTFWEKDQYTPGDFKAALTQHRKQIAELIELRGRQLAAQQPEWTKELGPVPANTRNARHWYRVAAEVEAYRHKYNVPDYETNAVPKKYREGERGAYLQEQVIDVHKRSRLSSTWIAPNRLTDQALDAEFAYAQKYKVSEVQQLIEAQREIKPLTDKDFDLDRVRKQEEKKVMEVAQRLAHKVGDSTLVEALNQANIAKGTVAQAQAHRSLVESDVLRSAFADWKLLSKAEYGYDKALESGNPQRIKHAERKYHFLEEQYIAVYGSVTKPSNDRQWLNTVPVYQWAEQQVTVAQQQFAQAKANLEQAKVVAELKSKRAQSSSADSLSQLAAKVKAMKPMESQAPQQASRGAEQQEFSRRGPRL